MTFLDTERTTLADLLPGLDAQLAQAPLLDLEAPGNPALGWFRDSGGPGLLVPAEHGGLGASGVDAVRVQRAVGARSPSLAIATTMHHFSVASLAELSAVSQGLEWAMLQVVSEKRWLMSSGFAEGKPGQHILRPVMRARPADGGLRVSGTKKPCSLTWSMDILSASAWDPDSERLAILLCPADTPGITRRKFWDSWILAGAESDEVILDDVLVPEALVFYPDDTPAAMDPVQARGFVWFELLISASYLGAASALVERVLSAGRGSAMDRAELGIELEAAMAALERAAMDLDGFGRGGPGGDHGLGRALCVRYAVEQTIARVTSAAAALAGGMAFIGSSEVAYLMAASRALAFHPPARAGAAEPLAGWLTGGPLTL